MTYYICPKCTKTFELLFKKKKVVHCNMKCFKVEKAEYLRVKELNEHKDK